MCEPFGDAERQLQELEALQSIYNEEEFSSYKDAVTDVMHINFYAFLNLPDNFTVIICGEKVLEEKVGSSDSGFVEEESNEIDRNAKESLTVKHLPPVELSAVLPNDYPTKSAPQFTISCAWLTSEYLSSLCCKLDELWEENKFLEILYTWTEFLKEETLIFLKLDNVLRIKEKCLKVDRSDQKLLTSKRSKQQVESVGDLGSENANVKPSDVGGRLEPVSACKIETTNDSDSSNTESVAVKNTDTPIVPENADALKENVVSDVPRKKQGGYNGYNNRKFYDRYFFGNGKHQNYKKCNNYGHRSKHHNNNNNNNNSNCNSNDGNQNFNNGTCDNDNVKYSSKPKNQSHVLNDYGCVNSRSSGCNQNSYGASNKHNNRQRRFHKYDSSDRQSTHNNRSNYKMRNRNLDNFTLNTQNDNEYSSGRNRSSCKRDEIPHLNVAAGFTNSIVNENHSKNVSATIDNNDAQCASLPSNSANHEFSRNLRRISNYRNNRGQPINKFVGSMKLEENKEEICKSECVIQGKCTTATNSSISEKGNDDSILINTDVQLPMDLDNSNDKILSDAGSDCLASGDLSTVSETESSGDCSVCDSTSRCSSEIKCSLKDCTNGNVVKDSRVKICVSQYQCKNLVKYLEDYNEDRRLTEFCKMYYCCSICYQDKKGVNCMQFQPCYHVFCKDCISQYVLMKIKDCSVYVIKCPEDKCPSDILPSQVRDLVGPEQFAKYDAILLQTTLETLTDVITCPRIACQYPASREPDAKMVICPACHYVFCVYCKMGWHGVEPCRFRNDEKAALVKQYEEADDDLKQAMEQRYGKKQLTSLMQASLSEMWINDNSRNCPHCNASIEKSGGCNKMVCWRCSTFFCWICMVRLDPNTPYKHYNDPMSKCHNQLFEGVLLDDDDDDGFLEDPILLPQLDELYLFEEEELEEYEDIEDFYNRQIDFLQL